MLLLLLLLLFGKDYYSLVADYYCDCGLLPVKFFTECNATHLVFYIIIYRSDIIFSMRRDFLPFFPCGTSLVK
jgi:hypothetical protein